MGLLGVTLKRFLLIVALREVDLYLIMVAQEAIQEGIRTAILMTIQMTIQTLKHLKNPHLNRALRPPPSALASSLRLPFLSQFYVTIHNNIVILTIVIAIVRLYKLIDDKNKRKHNKAAQLSRIMFHSPDTVNKHR